MTPISFCVLSLIPALLLCRYVYIKDRVEKEPFLLLGALFLSGAIVYFPVIVGENALVGVIDTLFKDKMHFQVSGAVFFESESDFAAHSFLRSFFAVALLEEGAKWLVMYLLTFKNKHFGHLFDGIIYSIFTCLGFAVVENFRYAFMDGWNTFVLRVATSLPAHMIFGVVMGVIYTSWHMYYLAKLKEKILVEEGSLVQKGKPIRSGFYLFLSFIVPVFLHCIYSFARFYDSKAITIVFYLLIFTLFALSFVLIHWLSKVDSVDDEVAYRLLTLKYPELKNVQDTTLDELEEIQEEYFEFPPLPDKENKNNSEEGGDKQ